MALSELKEVIDSISSQPASYEDLIIHITDVLNNCVDEDEEIVLQCVVNNIVDQAIMDQNFRYNGVRMCVHLIENLKLGTSQGSFKDILVQRCQREISRRDSLAKATDKGSYLRGVTLFVGDLTTRIPEKELIETLPDLLNTLISHPAPDNIKSVCMMFKLVGQNLDEYYAKRGLDTFERIVDRLKKMLETEKNSSLINVITNVMELRGRGWKEPPRDPNLFNPYAQGASGDGLPDDHFFQPPMAQFPVSYDANGFSSYDFGSCGDEQDTNVCDAFEEFLRTSGQLK
jgi:polyadenylate-binding protein-interacting protein 1